MRDMRSLQDLKACILRCRRSDLDRLIKLTNLPRGGLKQDIQLRLIAYLDQEPSTEFLVALIELNKRMYSTNNLQPTRQANGKANPSQPTNDPLTSRLYLTAAATTTTSRPTEIPVNNHQSHPRSTGTNVNFSCQKDQSHSSLPNSQLCQNSTSVVEQSSSSSMNAEIERQHQFQQTSSSYQFPYNSSISQNPMITPSVWAAWASANKLLPKHQGAKNSSSELLETSHSSSCSHIAVTSIPNPSNQGLSFVSSQTSACTSGSESNKAGVTYKIGPLITLAGVDGSFKLPNVLPEFYFKESPFLKLIDVLSPPQIILPAHIGFATGRRSYDRSLALRFTSDQVETITYHCCRGADDRMEFGVQVIMRFARLDPQACQDLVETYELSGGRKSNNSTINKPIQIPQVDDSLPVHLIIQVNGRPIPLPPLLPSNRPGMDGRRNARPINITQCLHVSPTVPNYIKLTWTHDYASFTYNVVGIYLMRRRSPQQLCTLLNSTSFKSANTMRMEIIRKLSSNANSINSISGVLKQSRSTGNADAGDDDDDDDVVMPNTLPVQLLCPLSKCRIEVPVRGRNCRHVQCYDATTYLIINERKPTWNCPVCDVKAPYDDLIIDGLFLEVLRSKRAQDLDEVIFHADGSWSSISGHMMSNNQIVEHDADNMLTSESPTCVDYNQPYTLQESPYTSHITPNSIRSATDSVGSSSLAPSFNTLSPTSSVNSSSNPYTLPGNVLPQSPAVSILPGSVVSLSRNDVNTSSTGSTANVCQMPLVSQLSRDKEINQQACQEPSTFTIDLTLSDDENELPSTSVPKTSESTPSTVVANPAERPVNKVTPMSSSSSSLSPQFPPSEFSHSENISQFPVSSRSDGASSSSSSSAAPAAVATSSNIVSHYSCCSQTPVCTTQSNVTRPSCVAINPTCNYPATHVTPSSMNRFPSSSGCDTVRNPCNVIVNSSVQSNIPVTLSTTASRGSKRCAPSEYNHSPSDCHQSVHQVINNAEVRNIPTIQSVSSLSSEARHYPHPPAKVPRNEVMHNQFPGPSSARYQGVYFNNDNSNGNSPRRSTNSPGVSDTYAHYTVYRQQQSHSFHSRQPTSYHPGLSSDRPYPTENSSNNNTRYTTYNQNDANGISRMVSSYYPPSRSGNYPSPLCAESNQYNRPILPNPRNPYSCYDMNYRNSASPSSTREIPPVLLNCICNSPNYRLYDCTTDLQIWTYFCVNRSTCYELLLLAAAVVVSDVFNLFCTEEIQFKISSSDEILSCSVLIFDYLPIHSSPVNNISDAVLQVIFVYCIYLYV
uniref:SP-RING-type domain-containing protein n=1 Tax=Trichobilharzia regenti TaxID=157069 RepID=A0AA85K2E0_TRIRE|nr:unnamed protein product [Trichobilharzia regenti]